MSVSLARRALARAPLLAAFALTLTILLMQSSLLRLLPFAATPLPLGLWVLLALLLLLAPAAVTAGSPLPAMLAAYVPVVAAAAYAQSHLDWMRTLKEFHLTDPGAPSIVRVGLAALALALAWGAHALDLASRLRARAEARGVGQDEARAAQRAALRHDARLLATALLAFSGLVGVGILAYRVGPALGRATFLMPVVAAALVAVGAALLATRGPREPAPEAADAADDA